MRAAISLGFVQNYARQLVSFLKPGIWILFRRTLISLNLYYYDIKCKCNFPTNLKPRQNKNVKTFPRFPRLYRSWNEGIFITCQNLYESRKLLMWILRTASNRSTAILIMSVTYLCSFFIHNFSWPKQMRANTNCTTLIRFFE